MFSICLLRLVSALSFVSFTTAWTTYSVPHSSGGDDTPALTTALSKNNSLRTDATILFQQGLTYNILTPIEFPVLYNVIVSIQGNLTYAANIKETQAIVKSSSFSGHWFAFSGGSNITLEGSQDPTWGWVNSNGQEWWDTMQQTSSQVNRPHGWGFNGITNGKIKNMKLWQPVAWSFSTSGSSNLHIYDNTILAISYSNSFPYNTDGFSAGGTNILFENNVIYNGDDCLTVGNTASNIVFRNSYCNGGHGLSIGSLGDKDTVANVENVLFENVVLENCHYGARFKSYAGGNGIARNVTWKDITLKKVILPIYITQNYWQASDGPKPTAASYHRNVSIDTFTFQNFGGVIDDSNGNGVPGSTGQEVVIFDLYEGTAKSLLVQNTSTTTVSGLHAMVMCNPSTVSNDVGFKCWDGLYEPTVIGA